MAAAAPPAWEPPPGPEWDLGEVATAHSLWFTQTSGTTSRQAHRSARIAEGVVLDTKTDAAKAPYEGAQLVTVLLDSDGPKLLVDGVRVDNGLVTKGIKLPAPQIYKNSRGFYAPLVFSALVVGTGVPPAEVTVEFKQNGEVLERATMVAATDVDSEAACYLFPYPVAQTLHLVRATWSDGTTDGREEEGTDLGFLSSALARLNGIVDDMVPSKDAADKLKAPRKPAVAKFAKMGSVHRAVLGYALQVPSTQTKEFKMDNDTGKLQGTNLTQSLRKAETIDNSPYPFKLLDFYSKKLSAEIVVRFGDVEWTLRSADAAAINGYFQAQRSRLIDQVKELNDKFKEVRVSTGIEGQEWDKATKFVLKEENPLTNIARQVKAVLGWEDGSTEGNYNSGLPGDGALRVWGPPLLRKPTQQVVMERVALGSEPQEVREGRVAARDAFHGLASDFEDLQRRNRGPLRNVAWYPTSALPANAQQVASWTIAQGDPKVPRTLTELGRHRNAFATSGVMPLAASACVGAFLPPNSIAESQARSRLGGGEAQVDALSRLGLRHTPEAMAAMVAFGDLVVHECLRPSTSARPVDDPIDSAVRRAQRHALGASKLLRNMYAATERTTRLFLRETDPLFVTAPSGRAALLCMRHLPCWAIAIARDRRDGARGKDGATDRPLWSRACRNSATAFLEALHRLGKLERTPVHPIAFPLLPLQALWTWPPGITPHVTHGTSLTSRQRLLAQSHAATAGALSSTAAHTQLYAARLSVARAARLALALRLSDGQREALLHTVAYARPATVRANEVEALVRMHELDELRLDKMLKDGGAGPAREPPTLSVEALRKTWARRALDTFDHWRHTDLAKDEDDVAAALANLSLVQPTPNDLVQTFYVPFGLSPGASPLAGENPGISEARVWTRYTGWDPAGADAGAGANARPLRLLVRPCTPYDGVLVDGARALRAHSHPHLLVLDHAATGPSLAVPISLDSLSDDEGVDALRNIMFTAERLYQALQCAAVYGATLVIIEDVQPAYAKRFGGALALALGMLPNTAERSFALRFKDAKKGEPLDLARATFNQIRQWADALPVIALCEAAAVVATFAGKE